MNKKTWTIGLILSGLLSAASLLFTAPAWSHAMLESSSPANHATLNAAPKTLELKFGHTAKLTKLKLIAAGEETSLTVDPAAPAATSFSIALPELKPGAYQVKWAALSADGHAMTGSLSFTLTAH